MSADTVDTKQQPVYMDDVAAAIFKCATSPAYAGKTFELAGPRVYTNKQIVDYVFDTIKEDDNSLVLSPPVARAVAFGLNQIPNPWMTVDSMKRASVDLTMAEGAVGFAELGMKTEDLVIMEEIAERYLVRFRQTSMMVEDDNSMVKQPAR